MPAFIRGMFGDDLVPSRLKTRIDVDRLLTEPHQVNYETFVYGLDNFQFLQSRGIDSKLLANEGIVNFFAEPLEDRNPTKSILNWGMHFCRHKLLIMQEAMKFHNEIVWLDWDCELSAPLPVDFWTRLRGGRELQMAIMQYHNSRARWRAPGDDRCKLPSAAFIYCRDRTVIDLALDKQWNHRRYSEEQVLMQVVEDRMGGWKGAQAWHDEGYNPYCYIYKSNVFEPEIELFIGR